MIHLDKILRLTLQVHLNHDYRGYWNRFLFSVKLSEYISNGVIKAEMSISLWVTLPGGVLRISSDGND